MMPNGTVINHTADGVNLYDALGVDNIMVGTESNGDRAFKIKTLSLGDVILFSC